MISGVDLRGLMPWSPNMANPPHYFSKFACYQRNRNPTKLLTYLASSGACALTLLSSYLSNNSQISPAST